MSRPSSQHSKPKRIQRQRTKGWRMPEGAVYVGRPTKWGNPWTPSNTRVVWFRDGMERCSRPATISDCVEAYRDDVLDGSIGLSAEEARAELRGKDLLCWCPLDQPCHADVLLEIANR